MMSARNGRAECRRLLGLSNACTNSPNGTPFYVVGTFAESKPSMYTVATFTPIELEASTMIRSLHHKSLLHFVYSLLTVAFVTSSSLAVDATKPNVKHMIDTHIHLYDTSRDVYEQGRKDGVPWPPHNDKVLHKPHMPGEFRGVSIPSGVTGVVIVEASPRIDDNDWVLDLVKGDGFFVGLVGNIDPFSKAFPQELERLRKEKRFVGIRVHLMGRGKGVGQNEMLLKNLQLLADAGLSLDVLMNGEGPETIEEVHQIAGSVPKLRMVVNHVLGFDIDGNPPGKDWIEAVRELAKHKNVSAKISGLYQRCVQQPASQKVTHYESVLDVLWESFGSERLIYGSNWPCTKKSGSYQSFVTLVNAYFAEKGQEASENFFWRNASRSYNLGLE